MPWSLDQISGALTHTTTALEGFAGGQHASNARVTVALRTIADKVRVRVLAHDDINTGWELGINPANTAQMQIREVSYGVAAAAAAGPTAHNISAGVPFSLEIKIEANRLTLTSTSSGVAPVSVTYEITNGLHTQFRQFGVVTDVDGAIVSSVEVCVLQPQEAVRRNGLCVVIGDKLYFIADRNGITEIPGTVCDPDGPCRMAELDGTVYIIGGGKARKFDPVSLTLDPWTATNHPTVTLPGATDAGTTTATEITSHNGRIWLAVESALYFSAIDDPLDWKVNSLDLGAAGAGVEPVYDVIRSVSPMPNNAILVGGANSVRIAYGDPVFGNFSIQVLTASGGVSVGPSVLADAVRANGSALSVLHTPEGLQVVPTAGLPMPLHRDVLGELIQFSRSDVSSYTVSMARDPRRHALHLFIAGADSRAVAYDERTGDYMPNAGGFWPDAPPSAASDVTACVAWDGDLIMGTRDGRLLVFEDGEPQDDGEAFEPFAHLQLMADAAPIGDTLLHSLQPILSESSAAVKFEVFGADTPERVYDAALRRKLWPTFTATNESPPMAPGIARSAALIVRIAPAVAGTAIGIERLVAMADLAPSASPRGLFPRRTPPGPCRAVGVFTGPSTGTGTGTGTGVGTGPGPGTGTGTGTGTGPGTGTGETGTGTGTGSTGWSGSVWSSGFNQGPPLGTGTGVN